MILRRVRQHVSEHNWFAVGVDFVIVVLGVFIGIEVANWNEARQDRSEERRYYSQVREDLVSDLQTFARAKRRSVRSDRSAELVLRSLTSGPPAGVPNGRVAVAIHRAGYLYLPAAARGTYNELISTGNLRLLEDEALKEAIVDYYSEDERIRQWDLLLREDQKEYGSEIAGVLPRHVLRASIRSELPAVSDSELREILAEARTRQRLPDLLISHAENLERVRRDSEDFERHARAVIAAIDRRLGEPGQR